MSLNLSKKGDHEKSNFDHTVDICEMRGHNMKKLLIAVLLVLWCAGNGWGATYYITQVEQGAGGGGTNTGGAALSTSRLSRPLIDQFYIETSGNSVTNNQFTVKLTAIKR